MVSKKEEKVLNALTIDVEDYFQVSNFASVIPQETWNHYKLRVLENTRKVLSILDENNTRATFFILGWVAERAPELVNEIHEKGHEIASHGYSHELVYEQGPAKFRSDVARSKHILEEITGTRVKGYRAPSFTITNKTLWALDILSDEGYQYDASMSPIRDHSRYGIPNANPHLHQIKLGENKRIIEFPMSTTTLLGRRIPVAGGGYLRLYPYSFTKKAIRKINNQDQPAMVYLHPWELDPDQPRINVDTLTRFKHYINISRTEGRLRRLINDFNLTTIQAVLNNCCKDFKQASDTDYGDMGREPTMPQRCVLSETP